MAMDSSQAWPLIVWSLFTAISAALCLYGIASPSWIVSEDLEVSCGLISYCANTTEECSIPNYKYGNGTRDIPGIWWQLATWFACLGAILLLCCCVGIVATVACTKFNVNMHHFVCLGGILVFLGCIFALVGFQDMAQKRGQFTLPPDACRICGSNTKAFVLENCNIGDGLIVEIVGAILASIAACIGYASHIRP
eukprot:m.119080 g.119080  ORF g.119080 m.119080 type:complete len:195 (+) comp14303_c0_seq2:196-780(+)